jgi:outer membrane biosynthesis protein TonB
MIRAGLARVLALLATIVRVVCSVIGALIVVHAVFVLFEANPHNVLVQFTAGVRDNFGWFTKNLFTPKDPKIAQAINDGLAGLIWVVAGSLVSKLILRFAPTAPPKTTRKEEAPRAAPVRQPPPAPKRVEQPRAQEEPEPEPARPSEPATEPDDEPGNARHQARATARREDAARDEAGDRAQA